MVLCYFDVYRTAIKRYTNGSDENVRIRVGDSTLFVCSELCGRC